MASVGSASRRSTISSFTGRQPKRCKQPVCSPLDHRLPRTVRAGIGALITGTGTDGLIVVSNVYDLQPDAVFRADRAILQIAKRPTLEAEGTPISGLRRRKQPPARPNRKGMEIAHHPNYGNVEFVRRVRRTRRDCQRFELPRADPRRASDAPAVSAAL